MGRLQKEEENTLSLSCISVVSNISKYYILVVQCIEQNKTDIVIDYSPDCKRTQSVNRFVLYRMFSS